MSRRKPSKIDINMFPFLSVLCSVIGVLMLFKLMIISARVVGQEPPAQAAPPPPVPVFETRDPPELGIREEEYARLERQMLELVEKLRQRREEAVGLQRQIVELEELIALKEDESLNFQASDGLLPGVFLEKPEDVQMQAIENVAVRKTPRFVEVRAESYVVQPGGVEYPASQLEQPMSPLIEFLQQAARRRQREYLVLLIHPAGVKAFHSLYGYMRKNHKDVDLGKEPFSKGWLLISQQGQPGPESK